MEGIWEGLGEGQALTLHWKAHTQRSVAVYKKEKTAPTSHMLHVWNIYQHLPLPKITLFCR